MFQFKRRTLWIIIYITIPLIFILNQLGPNTSEPSEQAVSSAVVWSLDEVAAQCASEVCWLPLAGAQGIYLTAIVDSVPVKAVPIPANVQFSTQMRAGKWLAHWQFANQTKDIADVKAMLQDWLPANAQPKWVLTSQVLIDDLNRLTADAANVGLPFSLPTAAETADAIEFLVPNVGEADQLAYLMWFEVLKRRLTGIALVQWDHRSEQSRVLINGPLTEEFFNPVTSSELNDIIEVYQAATEQRERDQATLHRYAVNASLYQLPFNYFVQQPERLRQLSLEDVNRVREQTFGQIQKN